MNESYSKKMIKNVFNRDYLKGVRFQVFIDTMKPFIPYALIEMGDETFLPVNRWYKPLGTPGGDYYKYEDFPHLFLKKEEVCLDLLWDNDSTLGRNGHFLYSDSSSPCNHFQRYIEILSASIFLKKTTKSFDDFWNGKFGYDKEGWERNKKKFSN